VSVAAAAAAAAAAAGMEFQIFGGIRQNYVLSDPMRIHGNFSNLSETLLDDPTCDM